MARPAPSALTAVILAALASFILAGSAQPLAAQEQLSIFRTTSEGGDRFAPGALIEEKVRFRRGLDPVLGFTFGVAIDTAIGTLLTVDPTPELLAANGGSPLEFLAVEILAEGFTAQTTICSTCPGWSPSFAAIPIFDFVVEPVPGLGMGPHLFCFSGALGTPPVPIEVVNVAGTSSPQVFCGSVCITAHEEWEFAAPSLDVPYDRSTGEAAFAATLTIGEYPCEFGYTLHCPGFSFGLAHDPALLVATAVEQAPPTQALNGGDGPDFFQVHLLPGGITVGSIASLTGDEWYQFFGATDTAIVRYESVPAALAGSTAPTATTLAWSSTLGSPPVSIIIMPGDSSVIPGGLIDGTVTLEPVDVAHYIRGDLDESGTVDIGDPIALLAYLFQGGAAPWCTAAGDVDGSGGVDIGDPIEALQYLFAGGEAPRHPFPACGSAGLADCPVASAACP